MKRLRDGKALLLALILFARQPRLFAVDAKGWYQSYCDRADFHFTLFPGAGRGEELEVKISTPTPGLSPHLIWSSGLPDAWMSKVGAVTARNCKRDAQCEDGSRADILVEKITGRRAFGKYRADFPGRHLEGQFSTKYKKSNPQHICE
jgi:hypothetical protein